MATVAQPLGARAVRGFGARFATVPYHWQALIVIALSAFMVILDTTIVNVALPRIIQVFQSNVSTGQLVLAGYMLALAVVVLRLVWTAADLLTAAVLYGWRAGSRQRPE